MTVDRKSVESMAAIMASLNNALSDDPVIAPKKATQPDKQFSKILEAFRSATDEMIESGKDDEGFQTALNTQISETGVSIGGWEIAINEDYGQGKSYDVTHHGEAIASDLRLYDSAMALVKSLKEGENFTSSRVKAILEFDRDYARAFADATLFSKKMKIAEGAQHDIAEARYGEARRQALVAHNAIKKLSGL